MIHPQSVVHSLVEFVDGSYKAQLGLPDMRLPIQYALTYPDRVSSGTASASPETWPSLDFMPLDESRFSAYRVVRDAAEAGGNRGAILNAADEVAVNAFLAGRVAFTQIAAVIAGAVERWGSDRLPDADEITLLDREVREALTADIAA